MAGQGFIGRMSDAAMQAVVDRPWLQTLLAGGAGAGAGFVGSKLLNRTEGEDYDTPEDDRRRAIRTAVMASLGAIGTGALAAYIVGDKSKFEDGAWAGTKRLIGSLGGPPQRQAHAEMSGLAAPITTSVVPPAAAFANRTASLEKEAAEMFEKLAQSLYYSPSIPLQLGIGTMMTDPHLDDSARFGMSNAFTVAAANAGSPLFSGADLAKTLVRAGAGAAEGYVAGKVLGTIFALPPKHVTNLSRGGAIADAVWNTGLFGR